jgi:hypothetical protein
MGEYVDLTIGVTHYHRQEPNKNAVDSDMDFKGYEELEYDVIDSNGKILKEEEYADFEDLIDLEVLDYFEGENDD